MCQRAPVKGVLFLHYRLDFSIRSIKEKIMNGKDTIDDALGIMKYPVFTYLPLLVDFKEINGQYLPLLVCQNSIVCVNIFGIVPLT
jgi:hypothetical protein